MPHVYTKTDNGKCAVCGMAENFHAKPSKPLFECESCSNRVESLQQIGNIKMCNECVERENTIRTTANQAQVDLASPSMRNILDDKSLAQQSVIIDNALKIHEDFFNAETVAIEDLRKASQSKGELFDLIKTRQTEFQAKLLDIKEQELNINSRIRASQQALYDLVKQLTAQERADRKVQDIAFNPPEHKTEKAPKAPKQTMTAQEKMAQNLMNARWMKAAKQLMDNEGMDETTAKNVAIHRGLVITIEQARIEVQKIFDGE